MELNHLEQIRSSDGTKEYFLDDALYEDIYDLKNELLGFLERK